MEMTVAFVTVVWCVYVLFWLVSAFSAKRAKERQSWVFRVITAGRLAITLVLLAGAIPAFGLNTRIVPRVSVIQIVGDAVALAGFVMAVWARLSLGGNWSATVDFKEDHELVERGPYQLVRHPMYSGLLLMIGGTVLVVGRIDACLALILCFIGTWTKLRQEEALLTRHFPEAYPLYRSRTKALIPFLF
jgi:protein-S-isoprenylcysteine O-methyltransferase Ste14